MSTPEQDDRIDAYLWNSSAAPVADVQDLERMLEPVRFEPAEAPLMWPSDKVIGHSRRRWVYGLAAAAALVLVSGGMAAAWRWSWPAGRAWTIESAGATVPERLAVGSALTLSSSERARVSVARI